MSLRHIYSDHINIGSDTHGHITSNGGPAATQAKDSYRAHGADRSCGHTRVACRALQTLRQTRMQVHGRQGTWTQVLPDPVPWKGKAGCDLCSPARCQQGPGMRRHISSGAGSVQGVVRYQPRVAAAQRALLETSHGSVRLSCQCIACSRVDSQHGRTDNGRFDRRCRKGRQ